MGVVEGLVESANEEREDGRKRLDELEKLKERVDNLEERLEKLDPKHTDPKSVKPGPSQNWRDRKVKPKA